MEVSLWDKDVFPGIFNYTCKWNKKYWERNSQRTSPLHKHGMKLKVELSALGIKRDGLSYNVQIYTLCLSIKWSFIETFCTV